MAKVEMPPVAQFTLPAAGSKPKETPSQTGAPPPAQFSLPQGSDTQQQQTPSPFYNPLSNIAAGNGQDNLQHAIGAAKGGLQFIRGVAGVDTNPIVKDMVSHSPAMGAALDAEKQAIQPTNLQQQVGAGETNTGLNLVGPAEVKAGMNAGKDMMAVARQIASPKATLGSTQKLLTSFGSDPAVDRGAQAISHLVKEGVLKAGNDAKTTLKNTEAIKNEIQSAGEGLVSRLKSMSVQPILQPEELDKVFQDSMSQIEQNPYLDDAAKTSAEKMFQLFKAKLPKGKDIVASDILDARKAFDGTIKSMKPSAFDPKTENATSLALRAIRQNVNSLLAEKAPDAGVKESLAHQSALYDVLENVAAKGAGAVKKAEEVANLPGLAGLMARHPVATKVGETAVASGLGLAGLGGLNELRTKMGL